MKEFDIEAAKAGAPVMTRGGWRVRILDFDVKGPYPIVAAVKADNGSEEVCLFNKKGKMFDREVLSEKDLVMVSARHTRWALVHDDPDGEYSVCAETFAAREKAEARMAELKDCGFHVAELKWADWE